MLSIFAQTVFDHRKLTDLTILFVSGLLAAVECPRIYLTRRAGRCDFTDLTVARYSRDRRSAAKVRVRADRKRSECTGPHRKQALVHRFARGARWGRGTFDSQQLLYVIDVDRLSLLWIRAAKRGEERGRACTVALFPFSPLSGSRKYFVVSPRFRRSYFPTARHKGHDNYARSKRISVKKKVSATPFDRRLLSIA